MMLVFIGYGVASANASNTPPVAPVVVSSSYVDVPLNVKVLAGYRKVIISWDPVKAPVRYYRIEASTNGGTKWYAGPVTRSTTISLSQPSKNVLTTYHVVAVGYKELSLPSDPVSIKIK
jgi:hypothetical protein